MDLMKQYLTYARECRHGGYYAKRASGYFTLAQLSEITPEVLAVSFGFHLLIVFVFPWQ